VGYHAGVSLYASTPTALPPPPELAQKRSAARGAIDLGLLPRLLGYQVRLAQIAVFRDFDQGLGKHGISPGLFGVLVIIEANPGLKQAELARATHLDRSTVVSVIDNLEKRGLVERRPAEADRRSNALNITAEGTALLRRLKRHVTEHEKRLVKNLSADEQATLVSLLQKIFPDLR
jgi:DNA-binding MarR family transcriptional regulator